MSNINKHNYEAFYLDYLEGNLSEEDTARLFQFLENNPDLKSELEDIELVKLDADTEVKFDKEALQQNINDSNVEDYIIESVENIIDKDDAIELEKYLSKSEQARILAERYKKTVLSKQDIRFPEKEKLKQKSTVIYYITPLVSAAAIALIILLLKPFSTERQYTPVAEQQTEKTGTEEPDKKVIVEETDVVEKKQEPGEANDIKLHKEPIIAVSEAEQEKPIQSLAAAEDPVLRDEEGLGKTEPKNIESFENQQMESIAIEKLPDITNESDEPVIQQAAKTQQEKEIISTERRKINLLSIAQKGLKLLCKLNERDCNVISNFTSSGQLKSVTLETDKRKITTPAI
jgi:hypothetical protein